MDCTIAASLEMSDEPYLSPKKNKSSNVSQRECEIRTVSRLGVQNCYFISFFVSSKVKVQVLIIRFLQVYFKKVTKSGKIRAAYYFEYAARIVVFVEAIV